MPFSPVVFKAVHKSKKVSLLIYSFTKLKRCPIPNLPAFVDELTTTAVLNLPPVGPF
jgi:hypothetical protein